LAAGGGDVRAVEDGSNGADAARPGGQDLVEVVQGDAANGEPGDGDMGGRPADILEGDGPGLGFGWGGIDGSDGEVIRAGPWVLKPMRRFEAAGRSEATCSKPAPKKSSWPRWQASAPTSRATPR